MASLQRWVDDLFDGLVGDELDPRFVGGKYVDLGPRGQRARAIADRLNAVRSGPPKRVALLATDSDFACTRRGPWIYMSAPFAQRLSDDALAFVLGHEMAHHDLRHLSLMYVTAGFLGNWDRIELAADRHGLELAVRAGYSRAGALEALDLDFPEPEDPFVGWPPALAAWAARYWRRHPPMVERRRALGA